ncbi:MAG TPA: hypothetical protein VK919_04125 [Solirubrobacterales bacterium]|nr:hypothetical protein [Solirubrobacterales bacterium]
MELTGREFWTLAHGLFLGGAFLLAFAGGLAEFYSLRPALVTPGEVKRRTRRLVAGTSGMAVIAWATVITGTWVAYPWYREDVPESPRSELLADPDTESWHTFGMEWKEHVAWIAPMLATAAAVIVLYERQDLIRNQAARRLAIGVFIAAFVTAAIAGILGALITKKAPIT